MPDSHCYDPDATLEATAPRITCPNCGERNLHPDDFPSSTHCTECSEPLPKRPMPETPTTATAMHPYIKRRGTIQCGKLTIDVVVADAKTQFGRLDLLVTPIAGKGQTWVTLASITFGE